MQDTHTETAKTNVKLSFCFSFCCVGVCVCVFKYCTLVNMLVVANELQFASNVSCGNGSGSGSDSGSECED